MFAALVCRRRLFEIFHLTTQGKLHFSTRSVILECVNTLIIVYTEFLSEIGAKLRDWAVGQAQGSCYSWAALSSNDSKTL